MEKDRYHPDVDMDGFKKKNYSGKVESRSKDMVPVEKENDAMDSPE